MIPIIGISGCVRSVDGHGFYAVNQRYVDAVQASTGAQPLVVPPLAERSDFGALLDTLDGLLLTGAPSNLQPHLYGQTDAPESGTRDPHRDGTTLPLIRAVIERGIPLLAVCRGFQELNVALGGTLHQHLKDVPGRFDHRMPRGPEVTMEDKFAPRHDVTFADGGLMAKIAGTTEIRINSLHGQGVDRLAEPLFAEGLAPDGTVEAVSMPTAPGFVLGCQWHPEWQVVENPLHRAIFQAFGRACRERKINQRAA